jgi:chorismate mutase
MEKLRKRIDELDYKLLLLLEKRFALCSDFAQLKKKQRLPVQILQRENEILESRVQIAKKYGLSEVFVRKFFSLILEESRFRQEEFHRLS